MQYSGFALAEIEFTASESGNNHILDCEFSFNRCPTAKVFCYSTKHFECGQLCTVHRSNWIQDSVDDKAGASILLRLTQMKKTVLERNLIRNICKYFLSIIISAAFLLSNSFPSIGGEELEKTKIWISSDFQDAPNVNYGSGVDPFAPTVVDLDKFDWSVETDAKVRMCFDNSPLVRVEIREDLQKALKIRSVKKERCQIKNFEELGGEDEYKQKIARGLLVTKQKNLTTCHAIFPISSLAISLKHFEQAGISETSFSQLKFNSSTTMFPDNSIATFLSGDDSLNSVWTTNGGIAFSRVSMTNAWTCLLPAFRLYWNDVIANCISSSAGFSSDQKSEYHSILKDNASKMLHMSKICHQ